ncbi:DUF1822 family protein [Microcoleus sp. herbarium14]|uniref:DUF1822 family protein n=1 Tax=Microcoleus sp. herbarium14 TaxID=3055439 RepID=UPI002FD51426
MDIRRIEAHDEDSVHLVVEGSLEKLQRIEQLFKSGQLKEILGITVDDVQLTLPVKEEAVVPSETLVNLSQWLQNVVDDIWKTVQEVLDEQRVELILGGRSASSKAVLKAQQIVLGRPPNSHSLALVVAVIPKPGQEREIFLQVHPIGSKNLPYSLKFVAIDTTSHQTIVEDQAGNDREWIQLNLNGQPGEEFSIKIELADVSVTQSFII